MKKYILLILLVSAVYSLEAQRYFTRSANVSFHSKALLEDIDAYNQQGTFVIDVESKQVQAAVLIKGFQFEKALMQEHFNENYMESDEYPKAVFKGMISSPAKLDLSSDKEINCVVEGELTIRGITKEIRNQAILLVKNGEISARATFPVNVADFNISIPSVVRDKIAKSVEIRIKADLEKM